MYQQEKISYVSYEVFLFTQNLVVHVQLAAQISKVLFINLFVGSQALPPGKGKQTHEPTYMKGEYVDVVFRIKELTFYYISPLQLGSRAGENGLIQQTRLAGIAHWLEPQSGVAASLG
jgi:hypothetical protein